MKTIVKIVVSGSSSEANNKIIDDIFTALRASGTPSIFLDNYEENRGGNDYLVFDDPLLAVVCLKAQKAQAA